MNSTYPTTLYQISVSRIGNNSKNKIENHIKVNNCHNNVNISKIITPLLII